MSQMAMEFPDPNARYTDPGTSHQAAVIALGRSSEHRLKALAALVAAGAEGLTDFELETATTIKQTSIGKRRHELGIAGLVEQALIPDSDHPCGARPLRRPAPSGTPSQVWRITPAGCERAYELGITGARA